MNLSEQHNRDVENVQEQMKVFYARGQKVKIYHGSTNSTRAQKFEKDKFVDVSKLERVILVNTEEQYVLVEPNVPMDALVEETLKYGFIPPVVMEFPGITVGGGIQGGAGESSSFKHGLFHDTCLEYEMVLGNGEVIIVSPEKNEDLFYGTACSYGSLGIITLAKIRLIPAKDYIHLAYSKISSFEEAISLTEKKVIDAPDFIDGIMFKKNRGVVMVGSLSDKKDLPIVSFRNRNDEWFYLHADKISKSKEFHEEIIPIRDYLFRYDRGAFWMVKYGFSFFKVPFNRLTRFVFNYFCNARALYHSLHSANFSQRFLIQDVGLPKENAVKFLEYVANVLKIYPIWFIPLRSSKKEKLSLNYLQADLVISVGVWGKINQNYSSFVQINQDLEKVITSLKGRKWLYAHQYYPRKDFWEIYDETWYNSLREKYLAKSVFPDIYDKTIVSQKYQTSVVTGILKALRSPRIPIS